MKQWERKGGKFVAESLGPHIFLWLKLDTRVNSNKQFAVIYYRGLPACQLLSCALLIESRVLSILADRFGKVYNIFLDSSISISFNLNLLLRVFYPTNNNNNNM